MQSRFCLDRLEKALRIYNNPNVLVSDQGSQFTSEEFTAQLAREVIKISRVGRERVFDNIFVERFWRNVHCEDIYLYGYSTVEELKVGLVRHFVDYYDIRLHQSLGCITPKEVYKSWEVEGL